MSRALSPTDFQAFFAELWTAKDRPTPPVRPFPWQQRLVEEVADNGCWPDLLDLPTGSGKTAAVDIAIFLMALRDDMPRRVVFVVDRRVVVDQAARRARCLASLLEQPGDRPTVAAVAERLRRLAARPLETEAAAPLVAAELRGGIARDASWALRPDVPAILTSTVDQVGSRLLFRGYGVSRGQLAIHAGLLANDCLFLIDEVHLSQPFAQTLDAVRARYRPPAGVLPDRWQLVHLSATAGEAAEVLQGGRRTLQLGPNDLDPKVAPVLVRRLGAPKPTSLRLVKAKGADGGEQRRALVEACVAAAGALFEENHIRTVAVVVNRVATAQAVHAALLQRRHSGGNEEDVVLLTGRMRPFDRDDILDSWWPRLATGRSREAGQSRLVVVATQAIEAGADLDVDGLVTECASLDALRQRFGRVDRAGDLSASGSPSASVIVATSAAIADDDDPVYGRALGATWRWLTSLGADVDFGIQALCPPKGEEVLELLAPRRDAPMLFPTHLDRWAQTSPVPSTDPDVALWLHGIGDVDRDVQVVWRADLGSELLVRFPDDTLRLISACPPGSGEALGVPLAAARRWLSEATSWPGGRAEPSLIVDVSDVEGAREADVPTADCAPFVRWRGDRSEVLHSFRGIVAGDTIVVPSAYGGIAFGCWDPTNADAVPDLGLRSAFVQRLRPTLRLLPQLTPAGLPPPPTAQVVEEADVDPNEAIGLWLRDVLDRVAEFEAQDPWFAAAAVLLAEKRNRRLQQIRASVRGGDGDERAAEAFVVTATHGCRIDRDHGRARVSVEIDPETSSFVGERVSLLRHLEDVGIWAGAVAEACGLPPRIVDDIALAGRLHDVGKADPRFQASLWWPDRRPAGPGVELLAKSATSPSDRRRREEARRQSGYPRGARHELLSVALLEDGGESLRARAADWELVLHLIASHHGHARPFVAVAIDPAAAEVRFVIDGCELTARTDHGLERLDSGIPDRYWSLVRRYGWFGLAWLETLLRLGDHRASEMEETADATGVPE